MPEKSPQEVFSSGGVGLGFKHCIIFLDHSPALQLKTYFSILSVKQPPVRHHHVLLPCVLYPHVAVFFCSVSSSF